MARGSRTCRSHRSASSGLCSTTTGTEPLANLTQVYVESGHKRVFACALDWPGWCRAGKTEQEALEVLAGYAARYAPVAAEAGLALPSVAFDVVERVHGDASTDFGVPSVVLERDNEPLSAAQARRMADLVSATWTIFDRVVASAPEELRKGPRGGGRDRTKIVWHVLDAETAYAGRLGVRLKAPASAEGKPLAAHRKVMLDALSGDAGGRWPPRYAARRIAWHVLDHAWEIEDRTD